MIYHYPASKLNSKIFEFINTSDDNFGNIDNEFELNQTNLTKEQTPEPQDSEFIQESNIEEKDQIKMEKKIEDQITKNSEDIEKSKDTSKCWGQLNCSQTPTGNCIRNMCKVCCFHNRRKEKCNIHHEYSMKRIEGDKKKKRKPVVIWCQSDFFYFKDWSSEVVTSQEREYRRAKSLVKRRKSKNDGYRSKDNKYLPYAGTRKGVSSRGSRAIDRFSYVLDLWNKKMN